MRHHQTRRKGRSLKNRRSTRRRQQGGAAEITSANDWFAAISEFEARKGDFGSNYTLASLSDESLRLPSTVTDSSTFMIPGVKVFYPSVQPPTGDGSNAEDESNTEDIPLTEMAQTLSYLFYGDLNLGEGLINKGVTSQNEFIQYANAAKNIPDTTLERQEFDNKKVVWYLNELETALQRASRKERGFTSIYNATKSPLYILYLAANPVILPNIPITTPIPKDILDELSMFDSTNQVPAVPVV